jgi:uncharacterized protein with GYD domain
MLMKLTPEGAATVETLGQSIDQMRAAMEANNGTIDAVLVTFGAYDIVAIGTAESDEKLAWFASSLTAGGGLSVETLKGFSPEEWMGVQGYAGMRPPPYHK